MTMVEGIIDDRAGPICSAFALFHRGGIDSYIFGSSLGDTTVVCSLDSCLYSWLARMCFANHFCYSATMTHVLHDFGHQAH